MCEIYKEDENMVEFDMLSSACGSGDPAPACGTKDPAPACGAQDPAPACGTQDPKAE